MCTKAYIALEGVCVCKCGRGYSSHSWSVCADVCAGFHVDVHACDLCTCVINSDIMLVYEILTV